MWAYLLNVDEVERTIGHASVKVGIVPPTWLGSFVQDTRNTSEKSPVLRGANTGTPHRLACENGDQL